MGRSGSFLGRGGRDRSFLGRGRSGSVIFGPGWVIFRSGVGRVDQDGSGCTGLGWGGSMHCLVIPYVI